MSYTEYNLTLDNFHTIFEEIRKFLSTDSHWEYKHNFDVYSDEFEAYGEIQKFKAEDAYLTVGYNIEPDCNDLACIIFGGDRCDIRVNLGAVVRFYANRIVIIEDWTSTPDKEKIYLCIDKVKTVEHQWFNPSKYVRSYGFALMQGWHSKHDPTGSRREETTIAYFHFNSEKCERAYYELHKGKTVMTDEILKSLPEELQIEIWSILGQVGQVKSFQYQWVNNALVKAGRDDLIMPYVA